MGAGHTPTVRHDGLIEVAEKGRNWLESEKGKPSEVRALEGGLWAPWGLKYVFAGDNTATPLFSCPLTRNLAFVLDAHDI